MTGFALLAFLGPALLVWSLIKPFGQGLRAHGLARENFKGDVIPVSYGLLLLTASLPIYLILYVLKVSPEWSIRLVAAAMAFGLLGFADDRWGDRSVGGLKGHFRKLLRERTLTTGASKALGGGGAALLLSATLRPVGSPVWLMDAAIIALSANALNLADTRPVRALALFYAGTVLVAATLLLSRAPVPPALWVLPGAALPYLPVERARRGMLGDSGSNFLGGVMGLALVMSVPPNVRFLVALVLVGFHVFTEKRSLNAFIRDHRPLCRLDEWLRGPDV